MVYFILLLLLLLFVAVTLRPNAGHGLLILEVSRSHTTTHHSRQDSSGRVISSSQRPLHDNTTLTTDKYPCPRWDSNPRSQQASGRRRTPQTVRALGPATNVNYILIIYIILYIQTPTIYCQCGDSGGHVLGRLGYVYVSSMNLYSFNFLLICRFFYYFMIVNDEQLLGRSGVFSQ